MLVQEKHYLKERLGDTAKTYTLNESISNYKYIIVYTGIMNGVLVDVAPYIINVSDLKKDYTKEYCLSLSSEQKGSYHIRLAFRFSSDKTFVLTLVTNNGWSAPYIYKIDGLK